MDYRKKISKLYFLPLSVFIIALAAVSFPGQIEDAGFINFSLEEIKQDKIVKLVLDGSLKDKLSKYQTSEISEISEINKVAVTFKSEAEAERFAKDANKEEKPLIEKDVEVRAFFNDPFYPEQGGLAQMEMPGGWAYLSDASSKKIAIVDTGVRGTHEELTGRVLAGYNTLTSAGILANTDSDNHGHGTAMASLAAAAGNNGVGIVGTSYRSKIIPIKALNSSGTGIASDIAEGVIWAANNGADVINLSLGTDDYSQSIHDAIQYAVNRNIIVVAASGNDGADTVSYPARDSLALAVGSVRSNNARSSFSNYGPELDVVAPGEWVRVAIDSGNSSYGTASGTSASSAEVAGIVALGRVWHSGVTPSQLTSYVTGSAIKTTGMAGASFSNLFGYGLISYNRLQSLTGSYSASFAGQSRYPSLTNGQTATLTIRYRNTGSSTWRRGIVNLGTVSKNFTPLSVAYPAARNWINPTRPAKLVESSVAPGQTGTFTFQVRNNNLAEGNYRLDVGLVADGVAWFDQSTHAYWDILVYPPYRARFVSQSRYPTLSNGQIASLTVRYLNTGSTTWRRGVVNLGTVDQDYNWKSEADYHPAARYWVKPNRPAKLTEATVAPGQIGTFTFQVRNYNFSAGNYRLDAGLVADGIGWFDRSTHVYWDINVEPPYKAEFAGQSRYPTLSNNEITTLTIRYKNTGSTTWRKGVVSLGTVDQDFAWKTEDQPFPLSRYWVKPNRPARLTEDTVAPGQTGTFTLQIRNHSFVPAGTYRLDVGLVADGVGWFERSTHAFWDITARK